MRKLWTIIMIVVLLLITLPQGNVNAADPDSLPPQVVGIVQNEDGSWSIQIRYKGETLSIPVPEKGVTVQQTSRSTSSASCPQNQSGVANLIGGKAEKWQLREGAWVYEDTDQATFTYPGYGKLDSWQGQNVSFTSASQKGQQVSNDRATFFCEASTAAAAPSTTSSRSSSSGVSSFSTTSSNSGVSSSSSSDPAVTDEGGKCRKLDAKAFLCESGALLRDGDPSGVTWTVQTSVNVDVWNGFEDTSCQVVSQSRDAMRLSCEPGNHYTADKATVRPR